METEFKDKASYHLADLESSHKRVSTRHSTTPRVRGLSVSTAFALILGCVCYAIIHTLIFAWTLTLWNNLNVFYIIIYLLEELPNAYNLIVCGASFYDAIMPQQL